MEDPRKDTVAEPGDGAGPVPPVERGFVRSGGRGTFYRVVGNLRGSRSGKLPVLALHGGPGLPHDSLEPLEALACGGRPVVFYDQLGCGESERPEDDFPGWSVGAFLEELAAVRRDLGLDAVHILGHSWGGMLALEHTLETDRRPASLVLVGATASGRTMIERRQGFFDELPRDAREAIREPEAAGTFEDPGYRAAMDLFHRRYTCRLDPWPDWLDRALSKMDPGANAAMWGPPDRPGPLRAWDLRPRLGAVNVPALVVAGRHDGMAAGQAPDLYAGIPGSELVVLEESSHYPFAEEPERFLTTVENFLARHDGRGRRPAG